MEDNLTFNTGYAEFQFKIMSSGTAKSSSSFHSPPQSHRLLCWAVHSPFPASLLLWALACTFLAPLSSHVVVFFGNLKCSMSTPWVKTSSKSLPSLDNESDHNVFQTWVHRILGSCPRLMI